MMTDYSPRRVALDTFQKADDAWSAELQRCFGRAAGDKRYIAEGKGAPGSTLRAAHDAREHARRAWEMEAFAPKQGFKAGDFVRIKGTGEKGRLTSVECRHDCTKLVIKTPEGDRYLKLQPGEIATDYIEHLSARRT